MFCLDNRETRRDSRYCCVHLRSLAVCIFPTGHERSSGSCRSSKMQQCLGVVLSVSWWPTVGCVCVPQRLLTCEKKSITNGVTLRFFIKKLRRAVLRRTEGVWRKRSWRIRYVKCFCQLYQTWANSALAVMQVEFTFTCQEGCSCVSIPMLCCVFECCWETQHIFISFCQAR